MVFSSAGGILIMAAIDDCIGIGQGVKYSP